MAYGRYVLACLCTRAPSMVDPLVIASSGCIFGSPLGLRRCIILSVVCLHSSVKGLSLVLCLMTSGSISVNGPFGEEVGTAASDAKGTPADPVAKC